VSAVNVRRQLDQKAPNSVCNRESASAEHHQSLYEWSASESSIKRLRTPHTTGSRQAPSITSLFTDGAQKARSKGSELRIRQGIGKRRAPPVSVRIERRKLDQKAPNSVCDRESASAEHRQSLYGWSAESSIKRLRTLHTTANRQAPSTAGLCTDSAHQKMQARKAPTVAEHLRARHAHTYPCMYNP